MLVEADRRQRKLGRCIALLGLVVLGGAFGAASALTIGTDGTITDWGIRPFPQTGNAGGNHAGWAPHAPPQTTYWVEENNYSRVDYPFGIAHQPSPGGALGEGFDLEALYWRLRDGSALQVLVIASINEIAQDAGRAFRLGDLFLDVDADGRADFGVGDAAWSAGTGRLYDVHAGQDVLGIASGPGAYGGYPAIEAMVNPWLVDVGGASPVGQVDLAKAVWDYGQGGPLWGGGYYSDDPYHPDGVRRWETGTTAYEWTIPLGLLPPLTDAGDLGLRLTIECGNDVIANDGQAERNVTPAQGGGAVIPEPVTLLAGLIGTCGLAGYVCRRRRTRRAT